ncbi:MAG TPA: hypothetical protein VK787_02585 [Puia sp.]|jgi:hypothetical protein|nr:hypothetical protein [Puia sp.]
MIDKHLTDADIQEFVLEKTNCSLDVVAHMHQCVQCQAKAETYKLLFSEIKEQPKPAFAFDLSAAVLKQVTTEKSKFSLNSLPGYFIILSVIAAIAIPSYLYKVKIIQFYKTYILGIVSGVSSLVIYLMAITFLIFVIFQCIEMYKKYQRKIDDLNFY